jgi:hypothetical protein
VTSHRRPLEDCHPEGSPKVNLQAATLAAAVLTPLHFWTGLNPTLREGSRSWEGTYRSPRRSIHALALSYFYGLAF